MNNNRAEKLKLRLNEIRNTIDPKPVKHLELEKCERMISRLVEFSIDCEPCAQYLSDFEDHISRLLDQKETLNKQVIKEHTKFINEIESHITEQHDLVSSGYYTGIYMSLGLSLGLLFGLVLFENISMALPIGLSIGLTIGIVKDESAKKKGKVI